jgi:hypothetical protein
MHQYKTVTQILLILSIFNLVLGAPVVREIYDVSDDLAVPTAVGNAAVMSKEQHQSRSDEATASPSSPAPDESTTSHSPPPLDGPATVHSLPLPQDGSQPLYASSPSDGEEYLHESPTPPSEPASLPSDGEEDLHESPTPSSWSASLHASSPSDGEEYLYESPTPPSEPASLPSDGEEDLQESPTPSSGSASLHASSPSDGEEHLYESPTPPSEPISSAVLQPAPDPNMEAERALRIREAQWYLGRIIGGVALISFAGGWIVYSRHHHHRTIDPDWYVSNPSHPSCRCLNVPNHKRSDL